MDGLPLSGARPLLTMGSRRTGVARTDPRQCASCFATQFVPMKTAANRAVKFILLTQFLIEEQRDKHHINADLRLLIEVVARDLKDPSKPGKLRLMNEANPMAFIVEQAGGMATDGLMRILDIVPTSLHQRVPVFLGSKNEIERVTQYHHAAAQD